MKLGIVINTYYRPDGKSKRFLSRALNSVKNQKHQDYKVFLIGDKYDPHEEFMELAQIIDQEKIYHENLDKAKERDKYLSGDKLWCSGGVNSRNYGIEKCLSEGIDYICNLDHDDYWEDDHLLHINNALENIKYDFICTKSNYRDLYSVPKNSGPGNFFPVSGDIIHSSTCINFNKIPLRYRDLFEISGKEYPADADLWERISEHLKLKKEYGFLIDKITVILDKKEKE
jgi:glycosyltransferase involved in cell wall biosynthesis